MSLLDHLWDDTVAGPPPESGLGKLRKYSTFNSRLVSGKESAGGNGRAYGDGRGSDEAIKVTRKIMIVKPPGYQNGSPPVSPAGSDSPVSPFSGGGPHQMPMRREMETEALHLLLMMSEI